SHRVTSRVDDPVDDRRADLPVVEFDKRAGVEEVAGQGSTVPAILIFAMYATARFDRPRLGAVWITLTTACSCSFKIQGMQRPKHAILVYVVNLERHATTVSRTVC